jgi:hypothetical protein
MRAVKHPSEATLALHAGGDLGPIARWLTERHLRQCESCQDEILAFQETRRMVADLSAMPEVPWARLSAEMHANIRLGLAAGECVRETIPAESGWKRPGGLRMVLAAASVAIMLCAGLLIEQPREHAQVAPPVKTAMDERHDATIRNVSYSANGSMEVTHVDPLTGDVTLTGGTW